MERKSEKKKRSDNSFEEPPDGGWGWVIVFTSFMIQFVGDGVAYTFGLFFVKISDEYSEVGKSAASWIASIMIAVTHAAGPIGSVLVNKFGSRKVSLLGSGVAAFGFAISYFARSVVALYFSIGLVGGLGFGLLYLPAMVSVPQYFNKKRAFATGISVCGSGSGTFFFEWAIGLILANYAWREGLLITSGIILSTMAFGFLYRPLNKGNSCIENVSDGIDSISSDNNQKTKSLKCSNFLRCDALRKTIDLSLLRNPLFLLYALSNILTSIGYNVPYIYFPEIEQDGEDDTKSTLIGIVGVSNVVSRIVLGYLSDKKWINRQYLFNVGLTLGGIATIVSPHLPSLMWLRVYAGFYGVAMGIYVSLKSVILVDLLGLSRLTDAFGLLLLLQSSGFFIGAPIVGFLYDRYGTYDYGFYFAGAAISLSGLILFLIPLLKKYKTSDSLPVIESDNSDSQSSNNYGIINTSFNLTDDQFKTEGMNHINNHI